MLASAVHLVQAFSVNLDHFHTYDDGKKRGPDGRSVPLLSYQDWCEGFTADQMRLAKPVVDLDRCRPIHPNPRLPLNGKEYQTKGRNPNASSKPLASWAAMRTKP